MKIYVGNIPYSMTEHDLVQLFSEYGDVDTVNIIKDRDTGRSKGFAFVDMMNKDEALNAIHELHNSEIDGRSLKLDEARPREERPRRRPRFDA